MDVTDWMMIQRLAGILKPYYSMCIDNIYVLTLYADKVAIQGCWGLLIVVS